MGSIGDYGVAAEGTERKEMLRAQLDSLLKQRKDYTAKLGSLFYNEMVQDPYLRIGHGKLFLAISDIDAKCDELKADLAKLGQPVHKSRECANCGATLIADAQFCHRCAAEVSTLIAVDDGGVPMGFGEDEGKSADTVGEIPIPVNSSYRPCPVCGQPVPDEEPYCMKCGQKLGEKKPKMAFCPRCGKEAKPNDAYCGYCARKLR